MMIESWLDHGAILTRLSNGSILPHLLIIIMIRSWHDHGGILARLFKIDLEIYDRPKIDIFI